MTGTTAPSVDEDLLAAGLPALPRTAWLAIDLERLAGNLRAIRAALPVGVRVEAVVKADAYGHGAVPVARTLEASGADGLCVATWDEALELRGGGVRLPVLVLYPVPPDVARAAAASDVTLTLGDATLLARTLDAWTAAQAPVAGASGVDRRRTSAGAPAGVLRVQLEVETGFGRGGLRIRDLAAALRRIAAAPRVELTGCWSHLGSADDPVRSSAQELEFDRVRRAVGAEGSVIRMWHMAASGGLLANVVPPYDAVRPGLSIYGVIPDGLPVAAARAGLASALRPVLSLRARPVRVDDLRAGLGVSYGNAFVTTRPSRIATLPLGYADGYLRALTNRAEVLVRGRRVPLVGTVTMDAVMADVTDINSPPVTVDDEFVLLGEQGTSTLDASELARRGTTISWEVLAGMSRRLPRVYYAGARAVGLRTLRDESGQWRGGEARNRGG